jgi:hypothetical protein
MQHLVLVLSIILLTIIAGNSRGKDATGKKAMVMKMQQPKAKKASTTFSGDWLSVYSSRFDMIVN